MWSVSSEDMVRNEFIADKGSVSDRSGEAEYGLDVLNWASIYHLTVPAATVGARNLMRGSKGACVVRDRRGGSAGGDGEEETDSSCVLTAEVVVRCTPIIGRGVGWHAGEEERDTDGSALPQLSSHPKPLSWDSAAVSLITQECTYSADC